MGLKWTGAGGMEKESFLKPGSVCFLLFPEVALSLLFPLISY